MSDNGVKPQIGDRVEFELGGDDVAPDMQGKRTGIVADFGKHSDTLIVKPDQPPQGRIVVYAIEVVRVIARPNPDGTITTFGEGS